MKVKLIYSTLFIYAFIFLCSCHEKETIPSNDYKVAVYYVIPADKKPVQIHENLIAISMKKIQAWYQLQTVGKTFDFLWEEEIFQSYTTLHDAEYYRGDWWNKLFDEMKAQNFPILNEGTVISIWIEDEETLNTNYTLGLGGDACQGNCGAAMTGLKVYYPPSKNEKKIMTHAHELGHAFGLSHPIEKLNLPLSTTDSFNIQSIMSQSEIRLPDYLNGAGILSNEMEILLNNKFLKPNIHTFPTSTHVNHLNFPQTGSIPKVNFDYEVKTQTVTFHNLTQGDYEYLWVFGDGTVSSEHSPTHIYKESGYKNASLSARSKGNMVGKTWAYFQTF